MSFERVSLRAEAAGEEAERLRQGRLRRHSPDGRDPRTAATPAGRSAAVPVALSSGCVSIKRVDLAQLHRVGIQLIEKDRVEQRAGDLRRRRIRDDRRPIRLLARFRIARRDRDDPLGAEMNRRRERLRQPDAAVAVPRAVDFDRRKEERQRRRRHHVIDPQRAHRALAQRPLPRRHRAVLARLHPRHRLAGGVARRGQRERAQPAVAQALVDAGQRPIGRMQLALEHFAQRLGVDHALGRRQRRLAAGDQPAAPSQRAPRQVVSVDAEHVVDAEVAPHLGQLVDLLLIRLLPRGEERGVDAAGRDAGQDVGHRFRKFAGENPQHADLVRRPRSTTTKH